MTFLHMTTLADRIDRLNAAIGHGAAWLAIAVVLLQFALVVARYLFGLGSVWLSETVVYAHATLFMLAAAWTLQAGGHVRVDIFYADASARAKGLVDLIGALLLRHARGRFLNIRRRRAVCRSSSCSRRSSRSLQF